MKKKTSDCLWIGSSFILFCILGPFSVFAVLVGVGARTYNMVVAGQIVPQYIGTTEYFELFTYTPSWEEVMVMFAGIGIVGCTFIIGEKLFGKAYIH